jgi:hypothetical protein
MGHSRYGIFFVSGVSKTWSLTAALSQNGESPQVSFTVKNEQFDVSSWKSVIQFEAMKGFLRTGLQEHIKYNNALRHLIDLPDTLEDRANDRVREPVWFQMFRFLTDPWLLL